jgi:hypothetical protein
MAPALALATALALPAAAPAAVPPMGRIVQAVAAHNREAGRATPLRLAVALRFEGAPEPAATGFLWLDPAGTLALELRAVQGFVERHVLRAGSLRAARDGAPVAVPRPFLPPLHLLQAPSSEAFLAALDELGIAAGPPELGHEGAHDCYVLGERTPGRASVWIDQETLDVVRIDRGDGVRWRTGPLAPMEGVLLPAFVEVDDPEHRTARLEVLGAAPAALPEGLDGAWLLARPAPRPAPGAATPGGADGAVR